MDELRDYHGRWTKGSGAKKEEAAAAARAHFGGQKEVTPGSPLAKLGFTSITKLSSSPAPPRPAFNYANIDLGWPKKADYPGHEFDGRQKFINAQYNGVLGRKGLNASKDHPATISAIMAHWKLAEDHRPAVANALEELKSRGAVDGNATTGYWNTRQIGLKPPKKN